MHMCLVDLEHYICMWCYLKTMCLKLRGMFEKNAIYLFYEKAHLNFSFFFFNTNVYLYIGILMKYGI